MGETPSTVPTSCGEDGAYKKAEESVYTKDSKGAEEKKVTEVTRVRSAKPFAFIDMDSLMRLGLEAGAERIVEEHGIFDRAVLFGAPEIPAQKRGWEFRRLYEITVNGK
jgi:hypothetical protein